MDLEKIEFLPDDFEFVGDKQDITKDVVAPSLPAWKDSLNRLQFLHQCFHLINLMQSIQKLQVFRHVLNISLVQTLMGVIYLYVFGQVQDIHYLLL